MLLLTVSLRAQPLARQDVLLNDNWQTIASKTDQVLTGNFSGKKIERESGWISVNLPHNWDRYEGYRRLLHGNRHGDSWYRHQFTWKQNRNGKRYFLFFEGVGSYATVYCNGKKVGEHAGGRTSFTVDITEYIKTDGSINTVAVRAYHPAHIEDLPWVCGGCSDERGFSEGSQPMGIFRPVHLVITGDTRIEPFGVHAWSTEENGHTYLQLQTTARSYNAVAGKLVLESRLLDPQGKLVRSIVNEQKVSSNDSIVFDQFKILVENPFRWNLETPYLYSIVSLLTKDGVLLDSVRTFFGFRTIEWHTDTHQFLLNGKPVFINGVAEYEHQLGNSHAFTKEEIASRIRWIELAGFNALRDAHQPHNLLYGERCDEDGILWWTQFSAHIWFDTPVFRENFKRLLKEWVIERRNDPAVILWGLQNESKLPEDFAKECTELIRQLDPTASTQRLVTTCNGGTGTDWDVPQNWTGTYGGDPATYTADLKKQVLVGEYGAWRSLGLHTEGGFVQNGPLSEDRMTALMEQKVKLGEKAKDSAAGQFFWLLSSHDNPGRVQGGEGWRELDRIGPVNYKGMLTPWEEPTDVYYMFRSNYVPASKSPMVYIASHTWPERWTEPGIKSGIVVYSNCDEVELFNDIDSVSLGKQKRISQPGNHFTWNNVPVRYNVLYAVGYLGGKRVACDTVLLFHLPKAPHFEKLYADATTVLKGAEDYHYMYRINCGGPASTDEFGQQWQADRPLWSATDRRHWGSTSWTNQFADLPPFLASQRFTSQPVHAIRDWKLGQTFRYGREELQYHFPLPAGNYRVELYFMEPWVREQGMRQFDVLANGQPVLSKLDIAAEAGWNTMLKKVLMVTVKNKGLDISFGNIRAGQAIINAIAIAAEKPVTPAPPNLYTRAGRSVPFATWLSTGDTIDRERHITIHALPPGLYGADWLVPSRVTPTIYRAARQVDLYVAYDSNAKLPVWMDKFESTGNSLETDATDGVGYFWYRKRVQRDSLFVLGAENAIGLVAVQPVSTLAPAYDLKPVNSYRAATAMAGKNAGVAELNGKPVILVQSDAATDIGWKINTGVGDYYSITFKYNWPFDRPLNGKLRLLATGGAMMQEEPIHLTFTKPGKWNQVTIQTRTMINAGEYEIRFITEQANGLFVQGIDIQ